MLHVCMFLMYMLFLYEFLREVSFGKAYTPMHFSTWRRLNFSAIDQSVVFACMRICFFYIFLCGKLNYALHVGGHLIFYIWKIVS